MTQEDQEENTNNTNFFIWIDNINCVWWTRKDSEGAFFSHESHSQGLTKGASNWEVDT